MTPTRRQALTAGVAAAVPTLLAGAGAVAAAGATTAPMTAGLWRNVRDYGAVGDGRTDDSAAIRACFEDLPTSGSNPVGGIFFPAGTYLVSRMPGRECCIAPSGNHEITLAGVGSGSVLITGDDDAAILELNGELTRQDDNIRRCAVQGLHFIGGYSGVRLLFGMYNTIQNCFFHKQRAWAIELISETNVTGLGVLMGNYLLHTKGILVKGSEQHGSGCGIQIIGNMIGEDISSPAAVWIERGRHYGQVSVVANTFYEPQFDAIHIDNSEDVLVANNRIIRPYGSGLVADNCVGLQIIGNLFRDIGYASQGARKHAGGSGVLLGRNCRDTQFVANMFRNPMNTWKQPFEDLGKRTVLEMNVVAEEERKTIEQPS